jgi:glycosyltransferase involved in cell wall biosynthesis
VHVVQALFGYENVFGGAERYALELAQAMAERVPTTLVAFGATPIARREGPLRIEVVRNLLPFRRFRFDPVGPGMIPHLARADVIHFHQTPTMMASVALVLGKLTGRRVFTTDLGGNGLGLHKVMDVSRWYDAHLHISRFSRRAAGHDGLNNAEVIWGGVHTGRFFPPREPPARDFVLYAGRLLPHKGIDYLIEGLPPGVPLVIAGRPMPHARAYHESLRTMARGKPVRFNENCSDDELRRLYQNARCVVLPSVYQSRDGARHTVPELLGLTLLEGMACGTPAIGTDVASLPEVVEDGVSGFVVRPNDPADLGRAISALWADRATTERMGAAALRRVLDGFTWGAVVDRCLTAYAGRSRSRWSR